MTSQPCMKTLSILGKPYSIEYGLETHLAGNMGSANRCLQHICVNVAYPEAQQDDSLLHEVIHIIDQELKLGLTEATVARLATGLYSAGYHLPEGLTDVAT